jgi:hypothetical protein
VSFKSELRRAWAFWLLAVVFIAGAVFCFIFFFSKSWVSDPQLIAHAARVGKLAFIGFALCEIAAWMACLKIVTKPPKDTLLGRATVAGVLSILLHIPIVLALFVLK